MHPGWADTPGFAEALPAFHEFLGPYARTVEEGVDTLVWLAASDAASLETGRLFLDRRIRPFDRVPWTRVTPSDRRALWAAVAGHDGRARRERLTRALVDRGLPAARVDERRSNHRRPWRTLPSDASIRTR